MPTRPSTAATAARAEAAQWASVAAEWVSDRHPDLWADLPPTEQHVVRYYQPGADLAGRAGRWGYELTSGDLSDICRFGAALAATEAGAWEDDDPSIATRAYEDRRHLLGDRLLHWAIPWFDAAGRCHPDEREPAEASERTLLEIGDRLRPAPALSTGLEGLFVPGEDSYGPLERPAPLPDFVLSVWSGRVVMQATLESLAGEPLGRRAVPADWPTDPDKAPLLATTFAVTSPRWRRLAATHPGSARLWLDLAARAEMTAALLVEDAGGG